MLTGSLAIVVILQAVDFPQKNLTDQSIFRRADFFWSLFESVQSCRGLSSVRDYSATSVFPGSASGFVIKQLNIPRPATVFMIQMIGFCQQPGIWMSCFYNSVFIFFLTCWIRGTMGSRSLFWYLEKQWPGSADPSKPCHRIRTLSKTCSQPSSWRKAQRATLIATQPVAWWYLVTSDV